MSQIKLMWGVNGHSQWHEMNAERVLTIGRQPSCDIILSDPYVSRRHAVVYFEDGTFRLHNLSQTNPIVLNNQWRVAHNQNVPLSPGDVFSLGDINLRVDGAAPLAGD
ncbi:MAG: FHA domain-containing protein [Candidatus Promineifilaceae bacterium]|nr:FHA domain-containing protein [Candidatus Promineifilaceae bacterium]